jgi:hypothetical protein
MAATFAFDRDTGTQTGSPTKGTTRTAGVTVVNWKNTDTEGTAYSAAPITAGNNSYELWTFGHFSGSYNQVSAGLWAHTATAFGTGLTLKSTPACTGDGDRLLYTTPSATANANLAGCLRSGCSKEYCNTRANCDCACCVNGKVGICCCAWGRVE